MGIISYIGNQFHKPTGIGGRLVTFVMNRQNMAQYLGAENALELVGSDKALDIGFGNGYLINNLAKRHASHFFGIDISEDMLTAATSRNRKFIAEGRMALKLGDALNTGFPDEFFDKVYTVNTTYFWDNLDKGLAEIHRILKPCGVFVNAIYTKERLDSLPVTRSGYAKYTLEEYSDAGARNGFTTYLRPVTLGKAYCVIYRKSKDAA
ncbi:MAG: class I SAM-dependent methyltransferase [Oscillospiraceae bacterium]|jgi:ubiquinone/menaquinone biosynthesis C-methylase UbiE|nr:class I SAM-dependent methyltransferase [Oscillospiraceae bacterium]